MNPYQIATQITDITQESELKEQYWQPVVDLEGNVISYADWEEKNKA